jgi:hypothetical protein
MLTNPGAGSIPDPNEGSRFMAMQTQAACAALTGSVDALVQLPDAVWWHALGGIASANS